MDSGQLIQLLGMLLIVLLVLWVLFLLTREFWCWYFKINERLSAMEDMKGTLEGIERKLGGASSGAVAGAAGVAPASRDTCSKCGRPLAPDTKFCEYCGAANG